MILIIIISHHVSNSFLAGSDFHKSQFYVVLYVAHVMEGTKLQRSASHVCSTNLLESYGRTEKKKGSDHSGIRNSRPFDPESNAMPSC